MERWVHHPVPSDGDRQERVWQRVAPGLEPYPAAEAALPGAQRDPCCMGSAAEDAVEVVTGFLEESLESGRYAQAMARCAPSWARGRLRELAAGKERQARRLAAVYYLITGECYQSSVPCGSICLGSWCAALRERYHAEACGWMNYLRAAEGTTDPCLQRIFQELSEDTRRQAEQWMAMLEKSLR